MISQEFNNLHIEIERLLSMSQLERESEGVYAKDSQLIFLSKKINASKGDLARLNGIEHFISDLASSESIILKLLDDYLEISNDR